MNDKLMVKFCAYMSMQKCGWLVVFRVRHSRSCKVARAKQGRAPFTGMGEAGEGGIVSQSRSRSALNNINVAFTCLLVSPMNEFQYSIVRNLSWGGCHTSLCIRICLTIMSFASCVKITWPRPLTDDIDQSAQNYTFHSSITSIRSF